MSNTLTEPQLKRLKIFIAALKECWSISYAKGLADLYRSGTDSIVVTNSDIFKRLNAECKLSKGRINLGRKRNDSGL